MNFVSSKGHNSQFAGIQTWSVTFDQKTMYKNEPNLKHRQKKSRKLLSGTDADGVEDYYLKDLKAIRASWSYYFFVKSEYM